MHRNKTANGPAAPVQLMWKQLSTALIALNPEDVWKV